jgi:hypothetical protein
MRCGIQNLNGSDGLSGREELMGFGHGCFRMEQAAGRTLGGILEPKQ